MLKQKKQHLIKMVKYSLLLLLLTAVGFNLNLLGVTWASGEAITENILTDVELTENEIKDDVEDALSPADYVYLEGLMPNPYDVDELIDLRIHYEFELPQGHDYGEGDYYEFDLPDEFQVFLGDDDIIEGDLSDSEGIKYGEYKLEYQDEQTKENGKVTLTFNENIRSEDGEDGLLTKGWVSFNTKIIKANITSLEETIEFKDISEEASITLRFEPREQPDIDKTGEGDRDYNTEVITWTVDFNKELKEIDDPQLTDELGVYLELDEDSVKLYNLDVDLDGTVSPADAVYEDRYDFSSLNGEFSIEFTDPNSIDSAYRLVFDTDITDGDADDPSTEYENKATLEGSVGGESYSEEDTASVEVERGAPLEKDAKGVEYDDGPQRASWEVRVNYNKKSYGEDELIVTDEFTSDNHELDEDSFKVYLVNIDDETGDRDVESDPLDETDYTLEEKDGSYENGYILTIDDATDNAYKIKYDTTPIERVEEEETITFVNEVTFNGNSETASQGVDQAILDKRYRNPNYEDKTVDWVITINRDRSPMQNVYLEDDFTNMGLKIKEHTFNITGDDINSDDYDYEICQDDTGFDVEFKTDINERVTIKFTTYFDYETLTDKDDNFINEAALDWEVNGDKKDISVIDTFQPNQFTKDNGFKKGDYDAEEKEITWTIGVNYNLQEIEDAVVTDYVYGNQDLIEDSIVVYDATLPAGGGEPEKDGDPISDGEFDLDITQDNSNDKFEVEFNETIDSAYIIEFKTSLDDIFVADSYENEAALEGKINNEDVEFEYEADVNIPKGNIYVDKGFTYNDGSRIISWEVEINSGQSTISNVVVEDELAPAGEHTFLEDSFKLYETDVDPDGDLSKTGDPLVEDEDYELETEDIGDKSFRMEMIGDYETIDRAYIMEYQTFVLANDNDDAIKNKVTLEAEDLNVGTREEEKTVTVNITTGAGGIYNLEEPATLNVEKQSFMNYEDTGELLEGAEFELYFISGEEETKLVSGTTDQDGKLSFDNLAGGEYLLKEVTAPEGYVWYVEDGETEVIISENTIEDNEKTVSIRNDKILNAVELIKKDDESNEPISDAKFDLIKDDGSGTTTEYTTDSEGKIYIEGLEPGNYTFKESEAADGYINDNKEESFTIEENQTFIIEITFENTYDKGISLDKSGEITSSEGDGVFRAGDIITYTYTVTNTGTVTLTDVKIEEEEGEFTGKGELPVAEFKSSTDDSEEGTLQSGEEATYTATYTLTQDDIESGEVKNKATAEGDTPQDETISDTDNDEQTLEESASIKLEKEGSYEDTNDDGIVSEGDSIIYSYTVTNTGNVALTNINIEEEQDEFSGSGDLPEPEFSSSTDGSPEGTLQPGEVANYTATYTLTQDDIDQGFVDNEASATAEDSDEVFDDDRVELDRNPGISIDKTADTEKYSKLDDEITYTFTVENTGNVTLTDVKIDDAPLGISELDVEPSILEPGEEGTATATSTITQENLDAGSFINTAEATGQDPEGEDVSDSDNEEVTAEQNPDLALTKTGFPSFFNEVGDVVTFVFTVENTGNVTLSGVTVDDEVLGLSGLAVSPSTLAPGESAQANVFYEITQEDLDRGAVDNSALAEGQDPNNEVVEDTDTETVEGSDLDAAITIEKSASPQSFSEPGEEITYTFTVTNTGNLTLSDVSIDDQKLEISDLPLDPAELAPGESGTATATYLVTQTDVDEGEFVNFAEVEAEDPQGNSITNVDGEEVEGPQPKPSLTLNKSAEPVTYSAAGDVITYTFTVTNDGNVTLTDVDVYDESFEEEVGTVASLAPGESETFNYDYTITQSDIDAGEIENTATVTGTDPDDDDVTDTDDETVGYVEPDMPLINLDKSASPSTYSEVDDEITYTFTVENNGNVTLTDVTIDDPLDGLSEITPEFVDELAPGETVEFTAIYTVTQADISTGEVENAAIATGTDPEDDDVTDDDNEEVTYNPPGQPWVPRPDPEPDEDPEPDPDPDEDPDPEPEPDPDPEPDEDPDPDPEPGEDPEPEPDEDPAPEPEPDPDPESDEDPDPETREERVTTEPDQPGTGVVDVPDGSVPSIGEPPGRGEVTIDDDGVWIYQPDPGFVGEDKFTIIIEHPDGTEEIVTITVDVEDPLVDPTPRTDGVMLALIYALWLFVAASILFRKGIIPFNTSNRVKKK